MITIASIQRAVAREYRVPLRSMREPDGLGARRPERSHPRQVAMAMAALLTGHSLGRIGYYFGERDHSTVIYATRAVHRRRVKGGRTGQKIHKTMRRVTFELVRP